jgi:hypothetical protein
MVLVLGEGGATPFLKVNCLNLFLESGQPVKLQKSWYGHGQVGIEKKLCLKFIMLSNQCWHVEVLDVEVGIIEIVKE